jgi:oxygen-independent coproporphyrinogen-3 oxidase
MHDTRQALEAVRLAREAGFKHLGADLILGTPLGGHPRPAEDAVRLAGLGVDHLSAYLLSVEDGTPLERDLSAGRLHLPSEEQAAAQYLAVSRALAGLGFSHYEVSNHSLPGAEARHNAAYWALQPYLGLGPSAVSCLPGESGDGGTRWGNREAFEAWAAALEAGFAPTAWSETRDAQVSRAERLFLAFRTSQGLDLADLGRRWGPGAAEALRGRLEGFQRSGWVTRQDQRYTATEEGWLRSNALLAELLIALEAT